MNEHMNLLDNFLVGDGAQEPLLLVVVLLVVLVPAVPGDKGSSVA
jgi:hypothetical protein